jgi:hypothetical protein
VLLRGEELAREHEERHDLAAQVLGVLESLAVQDHLAHATQHNVIVASLESGERSLWIHQICESGTCFV